MAYAETKGTYSPIIITAQNLNNYSFSDAYGARYGKRSEVESVCKYSSSYDGEYTYVRDVIIDLNDGLELKAKEGIRTKSISKAFSCADDYYLSMIYYRDLIIAGVCDDSSNYGTEGLPYWLGTIASNKIDVKTIHQIDGTLLKTCKTKRMIVNYDKQTNVVRGYSIQDTVVECP